MNTTLVLVAIVIFSFAIGRLLTGFVSRYVTLSGAEYLLVGVMMGPHTPWKLLEEQALAELMPLLNLLLGLVGFVVGIQARRAFRRVDVGVVGLASGFTVVTLCALLMLPVLAALLPVDESRSTFVIDTVLLRLPHWTITIHVPSQLLWLALMLGTAAAVSSPVVVESTRRLYGSEGRVGEVVEAAARASQLTAIFVLGLVLASARATDAANRFAMTVTEWELAAVGIGVVCGLLFGLFVGRESESSRIFLATIGLVTFASGIGSALGISPLFVNLLAGVTVSVASPHADKLREQLERLAHPLFVLIMMFAGAMWAPVSGMLWLIAPAYVLFRFASRRTAMSFISGSFLETPLQTPRLGNGLLAQGTLAPAIAVNCTLRFPEFDAVLLSTVLVGALVSELWSQQALRKLLDDAGEIPTGSTGRAPAAASDLGATS